MSVGSELLLRVSALGLPYLLGRAVEAICDAGEYGRGEEFGLHLREAMDCLGLAMAGEMAGIGDSELAGIFSGGFRGVRRLAGPAVLACVAFTRRADGEPAWWVYFAVCLRDRFWRYRGEGD